MTSELPVFRSDLQRRLEDLLFEAVASAQSSSPPGPYPAGRTASTGGLAPWQVKRVAGFIAAGNAQPVRVADLAALARLSLSHFSRAFRASFGASPYAMVCRLRVEHAKLLMQSTDQSLADIAASSGFADQSHLSRLFRRHASGTPGEWRNRWRAAPDSGPRFAQSTASAV